jgi:hypothetical protein
LIFIFLLLENFIIQSFSASEGTLSIEYGRISNIASDQIHVAAAITEADCVRQCVDFSKNHVEYIYEDCFAFNYEFDVNTCELIHSIEPITYLLLNHDGNMVLNTDSSFFLFL